MLDTPLTCVTLTQWRCLSTTPPIPPPYDRMWLDITKVTWLLNCGTQTRMKFTYMRLYPDHRWSALQKSYCQTPTNKFHVHWNAYGTKDTMVGCQKKGTQTLFPIQNSQQPFNISYGTTRLSILPLYHSVYSLTTVQPKWAHCSILKFFFPLYY